MFYTGLESHVSTSPYNRALKISLDSRIEKLSPDKDAFKIWLMKMTMNTISRLIGTHHI